MCVEIKRLRRVAPALFGSSRRDWGVLVVGLEASLVPYNAFGAGEVGLRAGRLEVAGCTWLQ